MMKKILFTAIVSLLFFTTTKAQDATFGITTGFNSLTNKASIDGETISNSESGFFIGFFSEFIVGKFTSIQPQINYATIFVDDERLNELIIPIMLKYYSSEKLYLQVGPQFDYILEEDAGDEINKLGISIGLGIGYDITKNIFLSARYAIGLNNRLDLDEVDFFGTNTDFKSTFNNFQIGVGFRF